MKVLKILSILIISIFLCKKVFAEELNPVEIMNNFNPSDFLTLEDVDVTDEEHLEMSQYFLNNVIDKSLTNEQKVKKSFDWMIGKDEYGNQNITYQTSSNRVYDVFKLKKAVCQGYANMFKYLCYLSDVPCVIVNGDTPFGAHAWNYLYLDRWLVIDVTNGGYCEIDKQPNYINYQPMFITPYLSKDEDFIYYYANGISCLPINDNYIIPESVGNLPITSLSPYNGNKKSLVFTLTIPKTIEHIDNDYFFDFPNLEYINSNCSIEALNGVLYNKNPYIPIKMEHVKFIKERVEKNSISNLDNLKILEFLDGVKIIDDYAIENCKNLKEIIIPSSVTEINLTNIKNVKIITDSEVGINFAKKYNLDYTFMGRDSLNELPQEDNSNNRKETKNNTIIILISVVALINVLAILFIILKKKPQK